MAQQKSILKIEGTVGGLTFYKMNGVHLVKEKGGVSAAKIASDPNFVRTRENNEEFGAAGSAGKFLRDSLRSLMLTTSDSLVTSRATTLMHSAMKLDTTNVRGKRTPAVGLTVAEGKALLQNFNFNNNAILGTVLHKTYSVDIPSGVITMPGLVPANDITAPTGTTHINISGAMANIDFSTGAADVEITNVVSLPDDATSTDVTLTPTAVAQGTGINLFLLKIEFFQQVNGNLYPLKNGSYNSLAIVAVA